MERRRAIRYPLQVPASFSWEGEQGIVVQGEGRTRNISEKGVFVDAAICPPVGSSVELHFSLPALPDSERKMHVRHRGETLRLEGTEQGKDSGGFAITSREADWRYEDDINFGRSEKEQN
jgi:PilZ domain